ncbi:MAG: hypothetical protein KKD63_06735 [Proteobacteria bacterium]|nr:hypothetical protein [Desulfobulbaceae bacterium]MBU4152558.1 hypothetical protein [Pseudomonadota bacterium]
MRTLTICAAGILAVLSSLAIAEEKPETTGKLGKTCGGCHALPPGTGPEDGRFKPGSHAEHKMFSCESCHTVGFTNITEEHVNGKISLKPEIEYQYGTDVPWPSIGSGTCGGLGHPYQLQGCHEQMPDARCFWVPGKKCQTLENP